MTTTMEYRTKVSNILIPYSITYFIYQINYARNNKILQLSKYTFTEDLDDDGDGIPDEEDDDDDDDEGEL